MLLVLIGHVNFVVCGQILFCLESKHSFFSGTQKCYLVLQNIKTESFSLYLCRKLSWKVLIMYVYIKSTVVPFSSIESSSEFFNLKQSNTRLVRTGFQYSFFCIWA